MAKLAHRSNRVGAGIGSNGFQALCLLYLISSGTLQGPAAPRHCELELVDECVDGEAGLRAVATSVGRIQSHKLSVVELADEVENVKWHC